MYLIFTQLILKRSDALSDAGELWFLDFTNLTTAALPATIPWTDVEKAGFDTTNYSPVMALANNHVHFINVPGVAAGSADIFVIHCEWTWRGETLY